MKSANAGSIHPALPGASSTRSEAARHAEFSRIRYAQCWEDADILLEALEIRPEHVCLSIASGGDNTLAMLSRGPSQVIAIDLNPAQLACLELRTAAYRELSHPELLVLVGSTRGIGRKDLYRRCRGLLSPEARQFWDGHSHLVDRGIGAVGKFEGYFQLFRQVVLPLIHSRKRVDRLLVVRTQEQREAFYTKEWNSFRWRMLLRLFCSRLLLGRLGRDPSFFRYVRGTVANPILERIRYALTVLEPAENPYLEWILTGQHKTCLPYSLRPENFDSIRAHLDRLEWHCISLEDYLQSAGRGAIDRYNLSDIFEYISEEGYHRLLDRLCGAGRRGGRLAYWNMLVTRRRPESLAHRLRPLDKLSQKLHLQDKAFFYQGFVVEEIL